jgi:hypothetical protein
VAYAINVLMIENSWNGGAPGERIHYTDNLVVSTDPIGCSALGEPAEPTGVLAWQPSQPESR